MRRTYVYRLYPNKAQEAELERYRIACQRLYNAALESRIDAWRKQKKSLSVYDQQRQLTELRADDEAWKAISMALERSALHRLDKAFKAFFRGLKSGQTVGFPTFKANDRYTGFEWSVPTLKWSSTTRMSRVLVPKLGYVRFRSHRQLPDDAIVKVAHLKKQLTGTWELTLSCMIPDVPKLTLFNDLVGIDVGLTHFATLSTGGQIENPRFTKTSAQVLAERQRKLAHKQNGSNSRKRAKQALAKAHDKVKNRRMDHARKTAKQILDRFDAVAVEDLNLSKDEDGLSRGMFSKPVNDASWRTFRRCLEDRAECEGKRVIAVNPRNTSKMCSGCGELVPKDLSVRVHECTKCGLKIDRDLNAALNIKALGLSALQEEGINYLLTGEVGDEVTNGSVTARYHRIASVNSNTAGSYPVHMGATPMRSTNEVVANVGLQPPFKRHHTRVQFPSASPVQRPVDQQQDRHRDKVKGTGASPVGTTNKNDHTWYTRSRSNATNTFSDHLDQSWCCKNNSYITVTVTGFEMQ